MGLALNETKTRLIDARHESFNFLGFTIRHDVGVVGNKPKYWNIAPSKKSEQKIRDNVRDFLKSHGHSTAQVVADGLNGKLRGWLNYFDVKGVSYPAMSKRRLRKFLLNSLYRYYNRKSQRKCKLYGQQAFDVLVKKFGLIDPSKYART